MTANDGAGSIPYQGAGSKRELLIGHTPAKIVQNWQNPDYRKDGYPKEPEDRDATTAPLSPVAHVDPDQRMYEMWGFGPETQSFDPGQRMGGPSLAAGVRAYVHAPFVPRFWRVYFLAGGASQTLYAQPGNYVSLPSEFCYAATNGAKSDTLEIPGRGFDLALYADPGNGATITRVIVVALANVGGNYDPRK